MLPLVVVHSHGHGDHNAADIQFKNKANVELIPPTKEGTVDFFHLNNWPNDEAHFDLGQRELVIIPIPGHDEMSSNLRSRRVGLTGDTTYPAGYMSVM
jgi:glyoxylase-like metal-dependent hydrolase (beta-lactamase superfamily II)